MLKIYGRNNSVNVMKVLWTCVELNLPFTREDVGGQFGRNREPWYLAMNPNAIVPTIDDDGFVMWESNAIVRYLTAKHSAGKLWPTDPQTRASADRWMDWQQTILNPALTPVFWGLIRTPPDKRDANLIEASRQKCIDAFGILETHLGAAAYMSGDTFNMADIPVGVTLHRWLALPIERPAMPNLERYYGRLAARPGYSTHVKLPLS
jgi:glutathione S-transferase